MLGFAYADTDLLNSCAKLVSADLLFFNRGGQIFANLRFEIAISAVVFVIFDCFLISNEDGQTV